MDLRNNQYASKILNQIKPEEAILSYKLRKSVAFV